MLPSRAAPSLTNRIKKKKDEKENPNVPDPPWGLMASKLESELSTPGNGCSKVKIDYSGVRLPEKESESK